MGILNTSGNKLGNLNVSTNQGEVKNLRGVKILIADDVPINLMLLKEIMKYWNVDISTAKNGREVVELVKFGSFDALILDLEMPELNGFQAAEQIRLFNNELKIVALTGHSWNKSQDEFIVLGLDDCITKPFDPDKLYTIIFNLLFNDSL